MRFSDLLLTGLCIVLILYVTRINHMWGSEKAVKKAKLDAQKAKDEMNARNRRLRLLKFFSSFADFGMPASKVTLADFEYKLSRVGKDMKYINRPITAVEIYGAMKFASVVGVMIFLVGIVGTGNPLFCAGLLLLFGPAAFRLYASSVIISEDTQIEKEFPDLYLLLYSRLLNGAHTRLAPTLDDYAASLDFMYGDKGCIAMKDFVMTFRNYIEVYGDDCIAIKKLREKYRSSMVVNFCNLAVQALNDVDNSDKLLAFKIELSQKRMEQMTAEAKARVAKGQKMVYLIFVILAEFVILSWLAKLGGSFGGLMTLFG